MVALWLEEFGLLLVSLGLLLAWPVEYILRAQHANDLHTIPLRICSLLDGMRKAQGVVYNKHAMLWPFCTESQYAKQEAACSLCSTHAHAICRGSGKSILKED